MAARVRLRLAERTLKAFFRSAGERDASVDQAGARSSPSTWRRCVRSEGGRTEGRLDPLPYRLEVDADRGQRVAIEGVEQIAAGCVPRADQADELCLDALRCDTPLAQRRTDLTADAGKAVQQVLVADEAVPEAARLLGRASNDLPGVAGELFGHHRLPGRGPCLRCTVCLVTPSRVAVSCHDHPRFRALSTWRISSRSVSARRAATARNPTSGSLSAAPSAISSVLCIPVSIC